MGLFSSLALLFQGASLCHGACADYIIKSNSKDSARTVNRDFYIDMHGKMYDTSTDRRIYLSIENGDKVYKDSKTGITIKNISSIEREKNTCNNKQKAMAEGKRFYYDLERKLYCEITTGKYYKRSNGFGTPYGDPYTDITNESRYVYEYNEGPSDDELNERAKLYDAYTVVKNEYSSIGDIYMDDYSSDLSAYHKRLCEKNNLRLKMELALKELNDYDSEMHDKYKMKGM